MDAQVFEQRRLDLFRSRGFQGQSLWLEDGEGKRTYAVVGGDGECPTILVHGGIADASVWYLLAGLLPGKGVVLDRPGHGLSRPVDYTGVDYRAAAAEWLLHVADGLGTRQVDLVGNSMGGFFAMAFALAHPHRVRRLVLAGAPAGLDRPLPLFLRLWGAPLLGRLISQIKITDPETMRKRIMADLSAHPERIEVEALIVSLAAQSMPGFGRTVRTMLHAVSDLGGWRPTLSMREPMTTLTVPTLFAWGDRDSFAPPSSGQELASRMPAAAVEVLTDAGHLPQLDQPELLAQAIRRFGQDHRSSASPTARS